MGEFDVPANIKTILQVSGMPKLTYIGHSQGTSQMFAALADPAVSPKVAPYVDAFHALAPVVYLSNTKELGMLLAKPLSWLMSPAFKDLHLWHFELGTCKFDPKIVAKYQKECAKKQCKFDHDTDPIDSTIDYSTYGYTKNAEPAGYSSKCLIHYAQHISETSKETIFKKFDYGNGPDNIAKYGQAHPPHYDLSLIKSKVYLYLGKQDRLADFVDTSRISSKLTNADVTVTVLEDFGHIAFLAAVKAKQFYQSIIDRIGK